MVCGSLPLPSTITTSWNHNLPFHQSCKKLWEDLVYDGMNYTGQGLERARLCIGQPRMIRDAVKCLQEIVDAGCVVLPQGTNTGVTGG
jgi:hypothetical protein